MVLPDNIELVLHVATDKFPDSSQYEASQKVLKFIDKHRVRDEIKISYLDDLVDERHIFSMMVDPQKERRLPYLESTHRGIGTYSDYIGQQEIIEYFELLGLRQKEDSQIQD